MAEIEHIKVGDRVRVVREAFGAKVGATGRVYNIEPNRREPYRVEVEMDYSGAMWLRTWVFDADELDVISEVVAVEEVPC